MKQKQTITILIGTIIILSAIATLVGIFSAGGPGNFDYETIRGETVTIYEKGIYKHMSADVAIQGIAQDVVTLAIGIPLLLFSLFGFKKGSVKSRFLLTGATGYFFVTYMFYTAMGMYNELFLVYVTLLGLTFFALFNLFISFDLKTISGYFSTRVPAKFTGGFLIFNSVAIALMWLGRVVPPLLDGSVYPVDLQHYTTMIVQGFDLGLLLPISFVAGWLLLKKKTDGIIDGRSVYHLSFGFNDCTFRENHRHGNQWRKHHTGGFYHSGNQSGYHRLCGFNGEKHQRKQDMTSFKQKIKEETLLVLGKSTTQKSELLTGKEIIHLPEPVQKWLKVSGAVGKEKVRTVALKQSFQMKLKPEQKKWKHAVTQQFFNAENPAFIWTVRLKMAPFVSVLGCDKFIGGKGEMQMTLNGLLNLGKETGEKMDEGTLQRYLGETVWFPSGMVSPYISWEKLDTNSTKATMNFKGTTGSGTFYFNKEGFFEKFIALRYMGNAADARRYEWIITAQEHAEFNGIKIPTKLKATWMLESGPWTWLDLEITDVDYNPNPKNLSLII